MRQTRRSPIKLFY